MIGGKAAQYKPLLIWNKKGLGGAERWVNKDIDISKVSDRMVVMKVSIQRIIISIISVYVQHSTFDDSQKNNFYNNFISVVKGCVRYIFTGLFCISKREHLRNKEKCFSFHFDCPFRS